MSGKVNPLYNFSFKKRYLPGYSCMWIFWVRGMELGFELRASHLLGRCYHLSHISSPHVIFFVCFFLLVGLEFELGLCTCKGGVLPLEPCLQSILLWLIWRWVLKNYLPGLALNFDSPNLSLPGREGYRSELLVPGTCNVFKAYI
jgi:hypothetical protein